MTERERRFVRAYLGDAAGNATRAAVLAGYNARNAATQGSRLYRKAHVRAAIEQRAERADLSAEDALRNLGKIASKEPEKVSASDVIAANRVILQAKGALQAKPRETGLTVCIGFIQQQSGLATTINVTPQPTDVIGEVVASQSLGLPSRDNP